MVNLKEIKRNEILENNSTSELSIYDEIDNSSLTNEQKNELNEFVKKCSVNRVGMYYEYDYEFTPNYMQKLRCFGGYNLYNYIGSKIGYDASNDSVINELYTLLHNGNVRGIRNDKNNIVNMINSYKTINLCNDYNKQSLIDSIGSQKRKYIVYVGNEPLAQLTSSYSINYSSCYNLERGEYRASNIYLMNDENNYIVKVFEYNETNLKLIENDALKISEEVIARKNAYYMNDVGVLVNKTYGSSEINVDVFNKLVIDLIGSLTGYIASDNEILLSIRAHDLDNPVMYDIKYVDSFNGYLDYRYSLDAIAGNIDNIKTYFNDNCIGKDNNITWDIFCDDMIMNSDCRRCSCCGCLVSDDDIYYTEDGCECCGDCCWWCDYEDCYYSNNVAYIETPDGKRWVRNDCTY